MTQAIKMTIEDQDDCQRTMRRIHQLLDCGIFKPANHQHILMQSAFIDLMICMRDLLHKTAKYAQRVSFDDDILKNDYVNDVTDAVTAIRDACCHINSFKQHFDVPQHRGSFMVVNGAGALLQINDFRLSSDYKDDIAFFYGKNRLYFHRHIMRAFEEAVTKLEPMLDKIP